MKQKVFPCYKWREGKLLFLVREIRAASQKTDIFLYCKQWDEYASGAPIYTRCLLSLRVKHMVSGSP